MPTNPVIGNRLTKSLDYLLEAEAKRVLKSLHIEAGSPDDCIHLSQITIPINNAIFSDM